MTDIKRISEMEGKLDGASEAVRAFADALNRFEAAQADIASLSEYYGSREWFEELAAYERGEIPHDLKCGVLSEDLIYELLCDNRELANMMLAAAQRILDSSM